MNAAASGFRLKLAPQGDREILITRQFKAPRTLVFEAFTTPSMVMQWMDTPSFPITRCEIDLRVGGALRYEWSSPTGGGMGVSGEFLAIDPPSRLVHTEIFDEDWTDGESEVTTTFAETDGITLVTMTICYRTGATRDTVMKTNMEQGIAKNFDNLDTLLSN